MLKKVAIVVCAWPPQGGGIGNNAYYHLKELKKIGYTVKAFTPCYQSFKNPKDLGVEFLPVTLPIGKAGFLFSLFKRLKDFDIVHFYYPFFGTDLIIWLFKVFNKNKKLISHYEMDPVGQGWQKIIFLFYLKLFLPLIIRISDKIAVLSWDHAQNSYLKNYLKKYQEKFIELSNGVDTGIFHPKISLLDGSGEEEVGDKLRKSLGINLNDQLIIFVGGLDDQHFFKGLDILLKALIAVVEAAPTAKLMIIGEGNKRPEYEALAKGLGLASNIIFTGWIDNNQLPAYYNLGDILVLPSTAKTESFGLVIAEAQACGLPAVVSNWPGSRLTIDNTRTGLLVEPNNPIALAEKLIFLLKNPDLMKKMGEAAVKRVKEKYAWSNVIKKIDQLYRSL